MRRRIARVLLWVVGLVVALLIIGLGLRAWGAWRGAPLSPWHKVVPQELSASEIEGADWQTYLRHEDALFAQVRREVVQDTGNAAGSVPINRYYRGSVIDPAGFRQDWNRSYTLAPAGKPVGAVVLLHGLTDSPYSLRHIARRYQERGFVAIGIRMPGHGTVPAGLSDIEWESWMAATRLAVREARRQAGDDAPLHLVGFSNGGALAMKYALDSLEQTGLARPERLVLLSPMIGITRFARMAGLAGLPAVLPAFAKAAWLDVMPEFNPFKYNSFPVNGARQSYRLTAALQEQIVRMAATPAMAKLPPVLTFQSVMDFTVSTPAVLTALYAYLPANGSELVLFDVNRDLKVGALLNTRSARALERMMPPLPELYRLTVIASTADGAGGTVERVIEPGQESARARTLDIPYPPEVFSLSHVALPFPLDDPLYGMRPAADAAREYGLTLGALSARGERGALIVNLDALFRISSNPFYPYMLARIEEGMGPGAAGAVPLPDAARERATANALRSRTPEPRLPVGFGEDEEGYEEVPTP
ncbi:carboxylesterase [Cupriavidus respiraculi]|uniref:2-succinyl-6-hydroxy-2, 4-cyclohexadiene-1-carboxylate synthase n=1 Tax=Cupriavidus respiraculi TaxID=195930 RepID=A0ABM8WE57_9BURK|nr:alpha/beta hydrolase [Cupriavidus respiraculi]CAG9165603.1 2-succinyl-6-hydroxy-2, 4-cyclohexadiene-1-carboxylate synthase [Cupriavidus respiraculi]